MPISPCKLFSFSRYFNFCWYHSPNPHPPSPLFFLLSCFFDWMGDHATFHLLFYLMMLWNYTCRVLVPFSTRGTLMCVLCIKSHNVVFYWYFDLVSHTQTYKHTQHTQGPLDWQTLINIYLHQYRYLNCYVLTGTTFITSND